MTRPSRRPISLLGEEGSVWQTHAHNSSTGPSLGWAGNGVSTADKPDRSLSSLGSQFSEAKSATGKQGHI